ncbi:MAG TPA: hypothetical protein VJS38_13435, partial [Phenylobacterium sp.]|nr:hypothetical protein [Phenylobacterium sp.]
YRAWAEREPKAEATGLRDLVQRLALQHRPYGYRRVTELVRREGWPVKLIHTIHSRVDRVPRTTATTTAVAY